MANYALKIEHRTGNGETSTHYSLETSRVNRTDSLRLEKHPSKGMRILDSAGRAVPIKMQVEI